MLLSRYLLASLIFTLPCITIANQNSSKYSPQALACLDEYELNNFELAFNQCLPLAKQNDALAQYVVAMLYKRGKGVKQSQAEAIKWLTSSAEGGYAASQLRLGKMLSTGAAMPQEHAKAFYFFNRAALQNDKDAQFLVALCYQNGIGVVQNTEQALFWYNKAVSNGLDAPAISNKDKSNAAALKKAATSKADFVTLKLAADEGNTDAQFQVGLHYANGQDTAQDDAQAIYWLQKAAKQQNKNAMSYLAWMNMLGLGLPQNVSQAVHWFVSAHDSNAQAFNQFDTNSEATQIALKAQANAQAEKAIALLENNDEGDIDIAVKLLEQAAKNNHPGAQTKLAQLYQTGKGVSKNKEKARHLFEKAAKNGQTEAQYALGWIYFNGDGVNKNVMQAYHWFNQASLYGGARAKSAKQFVRSQMSPGQLALVDKPTEKIAKK